ncbi:MAG: FG-GAP repeat protein [Lysobacterales bacterium]
MLIGALLGTAGYAQTQRLLDGNGLAAESAYAVTIDGANVASGSPGESSNTGAVYARSCSLAECTAPTRIAPVDLAPGDLYGSALAMSGTTMAVAAPGQNPASVYVYLFSAGNWVQQARLLAPDGDDSAGFGGALALQGDRLLIGAPKAQAGRGAAYVYSRSGSVWAQEQRLGADLPAAGDRFGHSVALSGNTALIGAPGRAGVAPGSYALGAAYVYVRNLGSWGAQAILTAVGGNNGDSFGAAVSLDGDRALIGAPLSAAGAGSVYVQQRQGSVWSQQAQLAAAGGLPGDRLGWSVALAGDFALAGAPYARGSCGAAVVFRRITGTWLETPGAGVANPVFGQLIGWSVASDSQRFVLGSPGYAGASDHRGAAYWFDPVEQLLGDGFDTESATACVDPNA